MGQLLDKLLRTHIGNQHQKLFLASLWDGILDLKSVFLENQLFKICRVKIGLFAQPPISLITLYFSFFSGAFPCSRPPRRRSRRRPAMRSSPCSATSATRPPLRLRSTCASKSSGYPTSSCTTRLGTLYVLHIPIVLSKRLMLLSDMYQGCVIACFFGPHSSILVAGKLSNSDLRLSAVQN